jgi:hypothetical protein
MEENNHKGSEFKNIIETWDQNEKDLQNSDAGTENKIPAETAPTTELERLIKQEAAEYDNTNKEERILGGEKATVNDEESETDAAE